jgi:MFS transporter, SP family, solute carrier family 2 (myo-inositol transporter), member 13
MADSADEPLMRHEPDTDDDPAIDVDLSDVSLLLEKNLRHPGLFVWLLTFSAGISGLLFGCAYASPRKERRMADESV